MNKVIVLICFIFISNLIVSQQSEKKQPMSVNLNFNTKSLNSFFVKNPISKNDELKENYYGKSQKVSINVVNQNVEIINDTSVLILMKFTTDANYGLQFIFDDFNLSSNVSLYLYNAENPKIHLGAYTSKNNNERNKFAISPIYGKKIIS